MTAHEEGEARLSAVGGTSDHVMNILIVGCGFVADYYLLTLRGHPELRVVGVHDRLGERARRLADVYAVPVIVNLEAALADPAVELVLNLTNPSEHYAITRAALEAGKHVYSEKPLAMRFDDARELFELAEARQLVLAAAPCSILSESAQALWKAIREDAVGRVRVVYAEMDDGLVHRMPYRSWKSASGVPWPYRDEFEVGCTLEHAGYVLTWLVTMFGPATAVTAFASVQVPDKTPGEPSAPPGPDFSVACVEFDRGIVARLTCGILAPHDHRLLVAGDDGVLVVDDTWHYRSPVWTRRMIRIRRRTMLTPWRRSRRLAPPPHDVAKTRGAQTMDFARGPAELAAAVREGRQCRLGGSFALHVTELALAIHGARDAPGRHAMTTRFEPVDPMPWGL